MITSNLAGRARAQMQMAQRAVRRTTTLYDFSRRVAGAVTQDDVLWAVVHHVAAMIRGDNRCCCCRADGTLEIRAGYPPEDRLEERDRGSRGMDVDPRRAGRPRLDNAAVGELAVPADADDSRTDRRAGSADGRR